MKNTENSISGDVGNDEFLEIILSKESDADVREKIYNITYTALKDDDINIDTDLIDECVKTVAIIDGIEPISEAKVQQMREKVDKMYEQEVQANKKTKFSIKFFGKIAAILLLVFIITSFAVNANRYNIFKIISDWSNETFYLNIKGSDQKSENESKSLNNNIYCNIDEAIEGIVSEPIIPSKIPDGFDLEYIERINLSEKALLTLNYINEDKELLIYLDIYNEEKDEDIDNNVLIEKDDTEVVVYNKNNINHYIMKNNGKVQGVWIYKNVVYTTCGDISIEETKKIIDSIYNK
ncbi:DUF4367 domain-containing protein [Tissierella sp. MSJ-40]|uniref:DUF4367 domain-containing protein n=1 Tax=Tissierella simiarum TaxID=2841534 RepID=A0ABS6E917_9FIRM|nr:DUF4367 domain-containing protein [Tissierella simiarum]MBU5439409.1 DUF4367 domain-containing protein [Tissierella simiarum]